MQVSSFSYQPPKCKHCGGAPYCIPNGPYVWCCKDAKEDQLVEEDKRCIAHLEKRGYKIKQKRPRLCPFCKSNLTYMFTADEDRCSDCDETFPGV